MNKKILTESFEKKYSISKQVSKCYLCCRKKIDHEICQNKYPSTQIKLPESIRENPVEGKTLKSFVVDTLGKVTDVTENCCHYQSPGHF